MGESGAVAILATLVAAYLAGSLPTAVLVSRAVAGVDVRELGDGNMGARNVSRAFGWGPGIVVAVVDFAKGTLGVGLAQQMGLSLEWQLAAGVAVVLGHDFPIFAGLRGGQGFASSAGVLLALMPPETLVGLAVYGLLYLLTRRADPSAAVGMGLLAALAGVAGRPPVLLAYTAGLLLGVPAKKLLDLPRRRALQHGAPPGAGPPAS